MTATRNPIQCAASLLSEPDVVMLAGEGADVFCATAGIPQVLTKPGPTELMLFSVAVSRQGPSGEAEM